MNEFANIAGIGSSLEQNCGAFTLAVRDISILELLRSVTISDRFCLSGHFHSWILAEPDR